MLLELTLRGSRELPLVMGSLRLLHVPVPCSDARTLIRSGRVGNHGRRLN